MNETNPLDNTTHGTIHEPVSEPEKSSKTGCVIFGTLGCAWILFVAGLIVVAVGYYIYKEYYTTVSNDYLPANYNYNYNTNSNSSNENSDDALNDPYSTLETTEDGEVIGNDGTSYGFEIGDDFVDEDLYAYQAGAYADMDGPNTDWSALRVTIDNPKTTLPLNEAHTGSLWVGAILDNNYFIQIGMMSSGGANVEGKMDWSYFWEMWDDNDVYKYGLREPLANYAWDENDSNTFTMTCQDPETGKWEFWINDVTVGTTYTENCDLDLRNSYIFWEMTSTEQDGSKIPAFGPFTLYDFEYWDGYTWQPIEQTYASYSAGKVVDGTSIDQAAVCPPFGIAPLEDKDGIIAGSTVPCTEYNTTLWK